MAKYKSFQLSHILLIILIASIIFMSQSYEATHDERKIHIVYMGSLPEGEYLARSHHINMLKALGHIDSVIETILVRSYARSFNGFVANLTPLEASKLRSTKEVVSVFKSQKFQLQTTRSWDYMGFTLEVSRNVKVESDIIIGHIDSGVVPNIESFSDHGLGPVPKKWKGSCLGGKNFTCNKKLIGARFYSGNTAMDKTGHGTHTASIVAGRVVKNANFFGIANGTARGGVPSSRIATYKTCDQICDDIYIMAAFDDAIADNVDIITISLGNPDQLKISEDVIAIGSFHAMEKDILTVQAGGNSGGYNQLKSILSFAPWLFTVAASSTDRQIVNKLALKNGRKFVSNLVNIFDPGNQNKRLVYGKEITSHCNESSAKICMNGCIDPHLVKEKIIVCDLDESKERILFDIMNSTASGIVLREVEIYKERSTIPFFPVVFLKDSDFKYVKSYIKSNQLPSARILKSNSIHRYAPKVAIFSSKGPNIFLPEIFKPDITAPGIEILAGCPIEPLIALIDLTTKYDIQSGTSTACPHVSGAAAYVKSIHPDWSSSAIKSSLMTTAWKMNVKYNVNAELSYGAGHIDPRKASHPGLVYETSVDEYMNMFCSLGSEGNILRKMTREKEKCPTDITTSAKDLNYPAMTAPVHSNSSFTIKFSRRVTNVGHSNSTYYAQISTGDNAIYINVEPSVLSFVSLKERKRFVLTVSGKLINQNHISCSLVWFDGTHRVRSPIILYRSSIL